MRGTAMKNPARAAALFHALADQTRLDILDELRGGECCVCELTDHLQAGQSRLSFHLKVLKDAGVIVDRRDGRWMYYSLNTDVIEELSGLVESFRLQKRSRRAASCG
ncbi:winged helix-turn-helix transcriptional regulator [Nitrospirales bacterium NOB]|nr:winged helix-turn-helix transcriptional regulator [Nitrospirales bacterium NOB]QOJ36027.1 MAG: winged helix-turn-helix transcriptional regulator [Nitrospira sp.]